MPVAIITTIGTSALAGGAIEAGLATALSGSLLGGGLIAADAVLGAGLGAATSAAFGRDPGFGALTGGIGGAAGGVAPGIGESLGIGTTAAKALFQGVGGAAAGAITGQDPGLAALSGAGSSLLGDALKPSGSAPAPSGGAAGGGAPLASGITAGGTPDLTANASATDFRPALTAPSAGGAPAGIENLTVMAGDQPAGFSASNLVGPAVAGATAAATNQPGGSPSLSGVSLTPGATAGLGDTGFGTTPGGGVTSFQSPGIGSTPPASPNISGDFMDSKLGKSLTSPSTLLGLGGLVYQSVNQPKLPGQEALVGNLKNSADSLSNQGKLLSSYINTGQLPAGVMASVNNATSAAKATLRSRYAALGLSGSTSEATALSQVDEQAAGQVFEIANNLLQTGIKEVGLSDEIYRTILSQTNANDERMSGAIANFAAAIAGGGNQRGITLNVGGTA